MVTAAPSPLHALTVPAPQLLPTLRPDDRTAFQAELAGLRAAVEASSAAWREDGLEEDAEEEEEEEEEAEEAE